MTLLLYVNLFLVVAGFALEIYSLTHARELRFVRAVGVVGMGLLAAAYSSAIFAPSAGMPTAFVRPGLVCILAYIVARNIYDIYNR